MKLIKMTAAAVVLVLGATAALAQATTTPTAPVAPKAPVAATTPAPSTAAPSTTTAPKAAKGANLKTAKTPEGQACSAEADAKNLHGKERRVFRAKCKKGEPTT